MESLRGDQVTIRPATLEPARAVECQTCLDMRFVRAPGLAVGQDGFGKLVPCPSCDGHLTAEARLAALQADSRLKESELARRLDNFMPASKQRTIALGAARELLARRAGWLTVWGGFGSGKSYLATATVSDALAAGLAARYWMLADLLDALRDAYHPSRGESDYSDLMERQATVGLLVVDECQAFNPTEWALEKLRQITESRYRASESLATMWVSNVDPKRPAGALEPIFSRMTEFTLVEMNDGDLRPGMGKAFNND